MPRRNKATRRPRRMMRTRRGRYLYRPLSRQLMNPDKIYTFRRKFASAVQFTSQDTSPVLVH